MSKNLGKFLAGVGIGVGLGMLFAPEKGEVTRRKLKEKLDAMCDSIKDIDAKDVKKKIEKQIKDIKRELADLDKEKVLKIAKEKGRQIVKKSEELYNLAVEKGTPILEKAADDIRLSAIDVLNSITKKLEAKGNK